MNTSFWKYVLYVLILYAIISYSQINLPQHHKVLIIIIAAFLMMLVNNVEYIMGSKEYMKNTLYQQQYVPMANLNASPEFYQNNNFKVHDGGSNYYYGFYSTTGDAPEGNDLQNYRKAQDSLKYNLKPDCLSVRDPRDLDAGKGCIVTHDFRQPDPSTSLLKPCPGCTKGT